MDSFLASFDDIVDPRIQRTKRYPLNEIMFLSLVGAISGIKSWRGLEDLAEDRLDWLRTYFPFTEGVPSHQTIGRVMSLLAPDSLVKAFTQFLATL